MAEGSAGRTKRGEIGQGEEGKKLGLGHQRVSSYHRGQVKQIWQGKARQGKENPHKGSQVRAWQDKCHAFELDLSSFPTSITHRTPTHAHIIFGLDLFKPAAANREAKLVRVLSTVHRVQLVPILRSC
jgi:hypothetical protein